MRKKVGDSYRRIYYLEDYLAVVWSLAHYYVSKSLKKHKFAEKGAKARGSNRGVRGRVGKRGRERGRE